MRLYELTQLSEYNTSPGKLAAQARTIEATAGMEFEMVVPGFRGNENSESEPDYEQDESVVSIDDIINFFDDGNYNSRASIRSLERALTGAYDDWRSESVEEQWRQRQYRAILQWLRENYDDDDVRQVLGLGEEDIVNDSTFELLANKIDENPNDYKEYDLAHDEYVEDNIEDFDELAWLSYEGIGHMSDVESQYSITWPYWTEVDESEASIEMYAGDFQSHMNKPVRWGSGYKSIPRDNTHYIIEPDSSINGGLGSGDEGLEFISPPMLIAELIDDLHRVKSFAQKHQFYTNRSTGLHINVSLDNVNFPNIDYVKLVLLLGDDYILNEFGRKSNSYCKSALNLITQRIDNMEVEDLAQVFDKMRSHLDQYALAELATLSVGGKYTSVNPKSGWIEFRAPGGDWLNANFDKIERTLYRYVVALDAAADPNKYREEYLKKLYKLLTNAMSLQQNKPQMQFAGLYAAYVNGALNRYDVGEIIKSAKFMKRRTLRTQASEPALDSTVDQNNAQASM